MEDTFKMKTGKRVKVRYQSHHVKQEYKDEYTGEVLRRHPVRAAMIDELKWFNDTVWEGVEINGQQAKQLKPIRTRWVLCNKGDALKPEVRARLVACEDNTYTDTTGAFYASTPPLEAKRMLFSEFASRRFRDGKPLQRSFLDITKAYFNGTPRRDLHVRLPPELGLPSNIVGSLLRCVYGTRDAGSIWEGTYASQLAKMGFVRGKASPCCFSNK